MAKGQLNQFTDLGHLFPAATDVVVANVSKIRFFFLTLDGVSLWKRWSGFRVSRCETATNLYG
jgi:hypothetical protein